MMMYVRNLFLFSIIFVLCLCLPVLAEERKDEIHKADVLQQKSEDVSRPIVSITPRVWYGMQNINAYQIDKQSKDSFKQLAFPISGATIAIAPSALESTDFLFTVMYGTGTTTFNSTSTGSVAYKEGEVGVERTDIEFLVRHTIRDTGFNVYYGARYVRYLTTTKYTTPGVTVFATGTNEDISESQYYLPEIGLGIVGNITQDGRHRLFYNMLLGAGYETIELTNALSSYTGNTKWNGWVYCLDLNAGYEWNFSKNASFNIRYRMFMLRGVDRDYMESGNTTLHGPEAGIKISF